MELEKKREYLRKKVKSYRIDAVIVLGGVCVRCGFKDIRALQIDHINGGGTKEHREKSHTTIYRFIINNPVEAKKDYQCLCANCNWIKRDENGESRKHMR